MALDLHPCIRAGVRFPLATDVGPASLAVCPPPSLQRFDYLSVALGLHHCCSGGCALHGLCARCCASGVR
eukprot:UN4772